MKIRVRLSNTLMTDMYLSRSICGLTIMSIHVGFMVMKKTDLSMKT